MTAAWRILAIDIGGTSVKTAMVDATGAIVDRDSGPTSSGALEQVVAASVSRLLAREPGAAAGIVAAGIGVPEYVDDSRVTSREVIDWSDDLPLVVADLVGSPIPVAIESDVRCGAIAEHSALTHPDSESLLYLSWGTGISTALVLPGGLCWPGAHGRAIALGEWRTTRGEASESERLEDIVSGGAISRRFGPTATSTERISELADAGDRAAKTLLETAGSELASALVKLVQVLDPHHVVIGGGLGSADTLARRTLLSEYASTLHGQSPASISPAHHGADSGLVGIARVARALAGAR